MTRRTRALAFVLAAPTVLAGLWMWGLARYADAIPRPGADDGRETDAIVVLTGGSVRLEAGAALGQQGSTRLEPEAAAGEHDDGIGFAPVIGAGARNGLGVVREAP